MRTANNKIIIKPYRSQGAWVFDDPEVEIFSQPLICGIPGVINKMTNGMEKFTLLFSHTHFPDYTAVMLRMPDADEGWYVFKDTNIKGWIPPAYLKYFSGYPEEIYIKLQDPGLK